MAVTKTVEAVDACQEIAQNTIVEGTTISTATDLGGIVTIWWALTNETAHTGTLVQLHISQAASGDDDWTPYAQSIVGVGTGNTETITNNPLSAGGTSITCSSTTGYSLGTWVFLEDATFANSEWIFVAGLTTNTSITALDGVTRTHANTAVLNSVAGSVNFYVPVEANRFRIVYLNTYDSDGATVAIKCSYSALTALG